MTLTDSEIANLKIGRTIQRKRIREFKRSIFLGEICLFFHIPCTMHNLTGMNKKTNFHWNRKYIWIIFLFYLFCEARTQRSTYLGMPSFSHHIHTHLSLSELKVCRVCPLKIIVGVFQFAQERSLWITYIAGYSESLWTSDFKDEYCRFFGLSDIVKDGQCEPIQFSD